MKKKRRSYGNKNDIGTQKKKNERKGSKNEEGMNVKGIEEGNGEG